VVAQASRLRNDKSVIGDYPGHLTYGLRKRIPEHSEDLVVGVRVEGF